MFSSRTNWNLTPNALHQLLEKKRKSGERILDLTESNPTRCGFTYDPAVLEALSTERSMSYEPEPHGLLIARKAISDQYDRQRITVDPSNIFLTAGTSEAYSYLFRLLCNPGENVLVPKPSYPLFDYLCALNDVEARHYRLRYYDEWELDFESLTGAVDSSTRAILLVHPNNPTGSFVRTKDREAITKFAREHGLALISDEVFGGFPLDNTEKPFESFATEPNGLVFTLNGVSKWLGLPQMKLAWIIVSGDEKLVSDATNRLEIISDTYLSVGTPVQHALPALFLDETNVTGQIRNRIRSNYRFLIQFLGQSSLSVLRAEGGWNAIVRLPGILSDEAWATRILAEGNVLFYPGHFFEVDLEASVIVSLLPEESVFSGGIHAMANVVRSALAPRV